MFPRQTRCTSDAPFSPEKSEWHGWNQLPAAATHSFRFPLRGGAALFITSFKSHLNREEPRVSILMLAFTSKARCAQRRWQDWRLSLGFEQFSSYKDNQSVDQSINPKAKGCSARVHETFDQYERNTEQQQQNKPRGDNPPRLSGRAGEYRSHLPGTQLFIMLITC